MALGADKLFFEGKGKARCVLLLEGRLLLVGSLHTKNCQNGKKCLKALKPN